MTECNSCDRTEVKRGGHSVEEIALQGHIMPGDRGSITRSLRRATLAAEGRMNCGGA